MSVYEVPNVQEATCQITLFDSLDSLYWQHFACITDSKSSIRVVGSVSRVEVRGNAVTAFQKASVVQNTAVRILC